MFNISSQGLGFFTLWTCFRQMVNLTIAIGLETRRTSLKSLSLANYRQLEIFNIPSHYRLCAISKATGILKNYRSLSKKHGDRTPHCRRPGLTICYGLKIRNRELSSTGGLSIPLNNHMLGVLSEPGLKILSHSQRTPWASPTRKGQRLQSARE